MKKSELFKALALGMTGAYVLCKIQESNSNAFGLLTSEQKVHSLYNKIKNDFVIHPKLDNILKNVSHRSQEIRYNRAKDITPRGSK